MKVDVEQVRQIIGRTPQKPNYLIAILQDIQRDLHYLPREALDETAKALDIPLSKVYSVATFYNAFSLTPRGETIIRVCQGTACHIKGADLILEQLEAGLGLKAGETSEDLKYTVEVVNCVGACAMAPVMIVNEKYHGNCRCDQATRYVKRAKKG